LHPLRHQPVDQEGEVEIAAARPQLLGIRLQRDQVVVEEKLRLVEQPAIRADLPSPMSGRS
jgi:hypothetical protein